MEVSGHIPEGLDAAGRRTRGEPKGREVPGGGWKEEGLEATADRMGAQGHLSEALHVD